jgi:hypothetical protein
VRVSINLPRSLHLLNLRCAYLLWVGGWRVLLSHSACADAKLNNKAGSGGGAAIMQCFSPDHVPVMYVFRALLASSRADSVCVCDNVRPCRAHVLRYERSVKREEAHDVATIAIRSPLLTCATA